MLSGSRGVPATFTLQGELWSRAIRFHILHMSPERVFTWERTGEAGHLNQRCVFLLRDAVKLGVAMRLSRSSQDQDFSTISCSFLSFFFFFFGCVAYEISLS